MSIADHAVPQAHEHLGWICTREIRPADWEALQRFHARLSMDTIHARFHAAKKDLTEPLAHRLTTLDGVDEAAVVAFDTKNNEIVGVARYARIGADIAEVAFVVEDDFQSHGIGSMLMAELRELARKNHIHTFVADMLADNIPMMSLMRDCGTVRAVWRDGDCEAWVDLEAPKHNVDA